MRREIGKERGEGRRVEGGRGSERVEGDGGGQGIELTLVKETERLLELCNLRAHRSLSVTRQ